MRILFLHEVNYLTKPIFEMHEFPEHLAKLGHDVAFVQFPEGFTQRQIKALGYRQRISGRVLKDVQIDLFTPWTINGGMSGRLFTAAVSFWQFKNLLGNYKPDIVVSFSVPTSGWQALIVAKKANVPFLFRALDVSHRIRQGAFSSLIRSAERFIYRNSDAISANNPAMLDYCFDLAGTRDLIGEVHNPPLDLSKFAKGSRVRGRRQLGVGASERLIVYMGSFFYFSGLPQVVRVLAQSETDARLVLVGAGEQDKVLRDLVKELRVQTRVSFMGVVPYAELPDLLAAADVAINPMEKTLVSDSALPNKVLQYMASGVPVVSTALKGLVSVFGHTSGITWGNTPEEVAKAAISLVDDPDRTKLSSSGSWAISNFAKKSNPSLFSDFLERVISKR